MKNAPNVDSARSYFEHIATLGHEPRLARVQGDCEVEVEGTATWVLHVAHGDISVTEGPSTATPLAKLRCSEPMLVRLARGQDHENLFTAAIRGAVEVHGDIPFLGALQMLLPLPCVEDAPHAKRTSAP